jgi:hypothetical protein
MEENDNGMVYVIENKLVLTVEIIDPNNLEYIDIEIGGDKKREYPQTEFKKKKFPELNFEIEVDHRYQNKKDIDIKSADSDGNFNKVNFEPKDDWMADDYDWRLYGNSNRNTSNGTTRAPGDPFLLSTGTYIYMNYHTEVPKSWATDIKSRLYTNIKDMHDYIDVHYIGTWFAHGVSVEVETSFLKSTAWMDEKYQFAGILLHSVLELFETKDFFKIRYNLWKFSNYYINEHLKDPLYYVFDQFTNDVETLLFIYEFTDVLDDIYDFVSRRVPKYLLETMDLQNYLNDDDNDNVPNIIKLGYGMHIRHSDNDVDEDGISNFDELRVDFRRGQTTSELYGGGHIGIDINPDDQKSDLKGFGYYESKDQLVSIVTGSAFVIKSGLTPEGFRYYVNKRCVGDDRVYFAFILTYENDKTNIGTFKIFRSDVPIDGLFLFLSKLPFTISFNEETERRFLQDDEYKNTNPYHRVSPMIKDIFVEIDYMKKRNSNNDHKMSVTAKLLVIQTFKDHGIRLHIDDGTNGFNMGGGGPITHNKYTNYNTVTSYYNNEDYFNGDRKGIFHYCVFVHYLKLNGEYKGLGGFSKEDSGRISMLSQLNNQDKDGLSDIHHSNYYASSGDYFAIADHTHPDYYEVSQKYLFMHELGHNLGLGYDEDRKKNNRDYTDSVMDYDNELKNVLDYSKQEWNEIMLPHSYLKKVLDGKIIGYEKI